jgi:diphthine-ammonia ligase
MKVGVLFSGGKDSTYAAWLARKKGYEIECLITVVSKNNDSFMFHTPAIDLAKKQAEAMGIPIVLRESDGQKEVELTDLTRAIEKAMAKYNIVGIITGAVESVYQSKRIQEICNELKIECFNPLWQKDQMELLDELVRDKFEAVIVGVAAAPFDQKWIGRKINAQFIEKMKELKEKYKINPAGEGGEFESFVTNCPLFKHALKIKDMEISGEGNAWRAKLIL